MKQVAGDHHKDQQRKLPCYMLHSPSNQTDVTMDSWLRAYQTIQYTCILHHKWSCILHSDMHLDVYEIQQKLLLLWKLVNFFFSYLN
ncbi:hypothetical protein L1887_36276 [Cichorium endivia]|nr:hypothetical protein L1887_36276 [Cichorium endivia]